MFATIRHYTVMSIEPAADRLPEPARRSRWLWLLSDTGIGVTAAGVAVLGIAGVVWMWLIADAAIGLDRTKLQLDTLKIALGVFAGSGAAAALLLAIRRQRHTETAHRLAESSFQLAERNRELALRAQDHNEADAAARRVTDLYAKAVEEIGSSQPAVRFGGMYALERLAQENPEQRQTIVNVLCAYLRMPFEPPVQVLEGLETDRLADKFRADAHELQVRRVAQQILCGHARTGRVIENTTFARDGKATFWPELNLDLTGAWLVDWDMATATVQAAVFDRCTFAGTATFGGAHLRHASFDAAVFERRVRFSETVFVDRASFRGARFKSDADFYGASFESEANFCRAVFARQANFDEAQFDAPALFGRSKRSGPVVIRRREPTVSTVAFGAAFRGPASFTDVVFSSAAGFGGASFRGKVDFSDAIASDDSNGFYFTAAEACGEAIDSVNHWPAGWEPDPLTGMLRRRAVAGDQVHPSSADIGADQTGAEQ